ncbi:hypothetical protein HPB51_027818 [Rhipicephalus microplus]|uniref:Endonuclease/exonuclease/phosphatase domain-containing protein n=1 Tax=Rhipicephalus microplus TaxID=6941 RepID=A0A9J6CZD7_RHIMP|nr:hypothetical protein HPB51_027818 [Rhipicephalus microplus]
MYSPPRDQLRDHYYFIRKRTKRHRLMVVGDFNAPHTALRYAITTNKSVKVHESTQQHGLTLLNDPMQPTRGGNSVSRNTNSFSPLQETSKIPVSSRHLAMITT